MADDQRRKQNKFLLPFKLQMLSQLQNDQNQFLTSTQIYVVWIPYDTNNFTVN